MFTLESPPLNTPLNVGLLGYGYASATFHAPLIAAVPGLRLAAIASSRPGDVLADWPHVSVCASAAELIARPDIDLVVIATPNDTHAPLAAQALAAGKHVVVDKPFTLQVSEARDLVALAEQHQRLLSVFHNRRWDADFLSLQAVLQRGELGRITHFESHFDRYRPVVRQRWRESGQPGSGLWYDLGPHLLDQALQLLGTPETLSLDVASQRDGSLADDWFHAVLRYGPMRVVLHASALTARVSPRFVVHGTTGSLVKWGLDTQEDALKAGLRPSGEDWGIDPQPLQLTLSDDQQTLAESQRPCERGDYTRYYAGVRDALLHGAPNPVPAHEAVQVMELIELGLTSARQGRVLPVAG
jgi:predicted dehydrogenase